MNERILQKLADSKDSINLGEEKLPNDYQGFYHMSRLERDGIYKNMEFTIQSILDICAIISKEQDLRIPNSDDDMLTILQQSNVFTKKSIEIIRLMKSFRNRLLHRYGNIDDELAYYNIKEGIDDFHMIFEEINSIIKKG